MTQTSTDSSKLTARWNMSFMCRSCSRPGRVCRRPSVSHIYSQIRHDGFISGKENRSGWEICHLWGWLPIRIVCVVLQNRVHGTNWFMRSNLLLTLASTPEWVKWCTNSWTYKSLFAFTSHTNAPLTIRYSEICFCFFVPVFTLFCDMFNRYGQRNKRHEDMQDDNSVSHQLRSLHGKSPPTPPVDCTNSVSYKLCMNECGCTNPLNYCWRRGTVDTL